MPLMSAQRQVTEPFDTDRFLATTPAFTVARLRRAMHEPRPSALRSWVKYHASAGRLRVVERGLYSAVPPGADPDTFVADPFLLAAAARDDGAFGYHAALELLGAAHSVAHLLAVFTGRRRRPMAVGSVRVEFTPHPAPLARRGATLAGVRDVRYRGATLHATGPERTLLDGFRSPRLAGGLEELVQSAAGFTSLDLDLVRELLEAYDQRMLWAAAGWFLERYRRTFSATDGDLAGLERHRPVSPHYLPRRTRGKGGTLVLRWNLILPESLVSPGEPGAD
jgi:predicted transcriptional regulator of viral defense system